ncbi:uncharacterized protein TNCV_2290651 [Trichonephila clavipes]|uniref:Secreted protein n=1 Tax=Trichonephila clavipes TaxID=2585209 RepID=A0A8X6RJ04_TRICX|nr:uncharacterized protein TNCV_2290651 [Trichonephila clavipes]
MTFVAAAWTLSSKTMAAATLDAASQTGVSSIVASTTNLGTRMERCHIFSGESRFCLQYQDCQIRDWRYRDERTLAACIRHRHTGPSPGVRVWDAIEYTSRSHLARIDGTLNSARYISGVIRLVALPFIRALCETLLFSRIKRDHMFPVFLDLP